MFCIVLVQIVVGLCFSYRGDEVNMCHFKENHFGLKNIFWGHGGPKMVLK